MHKYIEVWLFAIPAPLLRAEATKVHVVLPAYPWEMVSHLSQAYSTGDGSMSAYRI